MKSPVTELIGREAHAPGFAAVPKAIDDVRRARWGNDGYFEAALLEGILIRGAALEGLFEAAPFCDQGVPGGGFGGEKD